jgi:hypothetical protein
MTPLLCLPFLGEIERETESSESERERARGTESLVCERESSVLERV